MGTWNVIDQANYVIDYHGGKDEESFHMGVLEPVGRIKDSRRAHEPAPDGLAGRFP